MNTVEKIIREAKNAKRVSEQRLKAVEDTLQLLIKNIDFSVLENFKSSKGYVIFARRSKAGYAEFFGKYCDCFEVTKAVAYETKQIGECCYLHGDYSIDVLYFDQNETIEFLRDFSDTLEELYDYLLNLTKIIDSIEMPNITIQKKGGVL